MHYMIYSSNNYYCFSNWTCSLHNICFNISMSSIQICNGYLILCCSVDDGFPNVTFYFENGLSLKVYPHDYLFLSVSIWKTLSHICFYCYQKLTGLVFGPIISISYLLLLCHSMWKHAQPPFNTSQLLFLYNIKFKFRICLFWLTTYVPSLQEGFWCIGWQNSGMQSRDSKNMTLLGGIILLKSLSMPMMTLLSNAI